MTKTEGVSGPRGYSSSDHNPGAKATKSAPPQDVKDFKKGTKGEADIGSPQQKPMGKSDTSPATPKPKGRSSVTTDTKPGAVDTTSTKTSATTAKGKSSVTASTRPGATDSTSSSTSTTAAATSNVAEPQTPSPEASANPVTVNRPNPDGGSTTTTDGRITSHQKGPGTGRSFTYNPDEGYETQNSMQFSYSGDRATSDYSPSDDVLRGMGIDDDSIGTFRNGGGGWEVFESSTQPGVYHARNSNTGTRIGWTDDGYSRLINPGNADATPAVVDTATATASSMAVASSGTSTAASPSIEDSTSISVDDSGDDGTASTGPEGGPVVGGEEKMEDDDDYDDGMPKPNTGTTATNDNDGEDVSSGEADISSSPANVANKGNTVPLVGEDRDKAVDAGKTAIAEGAGSLPEFVEIIDDENAEIIDHGDGSFSATRTYGSGYSETVRWGADGVSFETSSGGEDEPISVQPKGQADIGGDVQKPENKADTVPLTGDARKEASASLPEDDQTLRKLGLSEAEIKGLRNGGEESNWQVTAVASQDGVSTTYKAVNTATGKSVEWDDSGSASLSVTSVGTTAVGTTSTGTASQSVVTGATTEPGQPATPVNGSTRDTIVEEGIESWGSADEAIAILNDEDAEIIDHGDGNYTATRINDDGDREEINWGTNGYYYQATPASSFPISLSGNARDRAVAEGIENWGSADEAIAILSDEDTEVIYHGDGSYTASRTLDNGDKEEIKWGTKGYFYNIFPATSA